MSRPLPQGSGSAPTVYTPDGQRTCRQVHWVRDVLFGEDAHHVWLGGVAHVPAALRNLTITLIRLVGHSRIRHPFDHPDLLRRFDEAARSGMGGSSCPFADPVFVVLLNTHDLRTGGPVTGQYTCSVIISNCDRRILLSCALVAGGTR